MNTHPVHNRRMQVSGARAFSFALVALLAMAGCAPTASVQREQAIPSEGFIDVPGGPVWYRVVGTGSATPLLVLHGGPGDRSCVYSPLAVLGNQRPIAFYDQLGSGRSGRPTDLNLWKIDRFVDELDVVRNRLGLTRVHLLGHSWGAALAVQYLLTKGTRGVESLILASPALSTRDWIDDANVLRGQLPISVQEAMQRNEAGGTTNSAEYQEATRAFSRQFGRRRPGAPNPECAGSAFNPVIYQTMWGPSEFYATGNLLSFDVTNHLGELRLPVLFIVGRYDEARPETMTRYQRLVPGSQLQIIEEAGHNTLADEPEALLRTVRDFLARVDRADAR